MSFRPTIADVACEAGVSRQTVSRALNNKVGISSDTLSRVREVIERLDYRPSSMDAIMCHNDLVAIGALHACAELGRSMPMTSRSPGQTTSCSSPS